MIENCISNMVSGRELDRIFKERHRSRKSEKSRRKKFEDKVWCVVKRMGFTKMSGYGSRLIGEGSAGDRQIDIFAVEGNFVLAIGCKSKTGVDGKIKNEIDSLANLRERETSNIAGSARYDAGEEVKIAWIIATDFDDFEEDAEGYAESQGIHLVHNWDYYERLCNSFSSPAKDSPAARYQFFANIFQDETIDELKKDVFAIKGKMGRYDYYQFSMTPHDLMRIAFVPHSASGDRTDLELYQRLIKPARLKQISSYTKEKGGVFPTNIVINLKTRGIPLDFTVRENFGEFVQQGILHIPGCFGIAEIIDGQHRLFSFNNSEELSKNTLLPVLAFDNMSGAEQAETFLTINGKQQKVDKNLLNQIVCFQKWSSDSIADKFYALPYMTIWEISSDPDSPFHEHVKMEGQKLGGTFSMTFAEITDKMKELGLFGNWDGHSDDIDYDLLYCKDAQHSLDNAKKALNSFFNEIKNNSKFFNDDWNDGYDGTVSKNGVVVPLLGLLKDILVHTKNDAPDGICNKEYSEYEDAVKRYAHIISEYFNTVPPDDWNYFKFENGKKGYQKREDVLLEFINSKDPSFGDKVNELKERRQNDVQNQQINDRILAYINDLEKKMKFLIQRRYQNIAGNRWVSCLPKDVSKTTYDKMSRAGSTNFAYYLDLEDIGKTLNNDGSILEGFVDFSETGNIRNGSQWIGLAVRIRDEHSMGRISSQKDMETFAKVWNSFNSNFDADEQLLEEWESFDDECSKE